MVPIINENYGFHLRSISMAYDPVSDEDQAPDYVIPLAFKDDCDVTFREETARDVFLKLLEEGISPYEDGG